MISSVQSNSKMIIMCKGKDVDRVAIINVRGVYVKPEFGIGNILISVPDP
jgi:hypothetical protein